jgi:hypothetical protein
MTQRDPRMADAGVFHVARELALRKARVCVLPTGWQGKDLDAQKVINGKLVSVEIQVKTAKDKVTFWPVGQMVQTWTGPDRYYAFVRRVHGEFEVFMEQAAVVAREVAEAKRRTDERGCKPWALAWMMSGRDAAPGAEDRTRRQWEEFFR